MLMKYADVPKTCKDCDHLYIIEHELVFDGDEEHECMCLRTFPPLDDKKGFSTVANGCEHYKKAKY